MRNIYTEHPDQGFLMSRLLFHWWIRLRHGFGGPERSGSAAARSARIWAACRNRRHRDTDVLAGVMAEGVDDVISGALYRLTRPGGSGYA